jgi:SAM-dependent methyltransferase
MTAVQFDYEAKQWGEAAVRPRPWYIQGLKLRYCLDALAGVTGSVLDVGCGAGNMAKAIKRERPDLEVFGVDVSRASIAAARRQPGGVDFRLGEGEKLPFADASLDAVTMFDVLEHFELPVRALDEVARVLKPGGVFHIALPLEDQPWTLYRLLTRRGWQAKVRQCGHLHFFSNDSFKTMAGAAGLPVHSVRWSFQPLFMLVDVVYFALLEWRGPASMAVEDYVSRKPGATGALLKFVKGLVASLGWLEASLLPFLPAGTGHFTCQRA